MTHCVTRTHASVCVHAVSTIAGGSRRKCATIERAFGFGNWKIGYGNKAQMKYRAQKVARHGYGLRVRVLIDFSVAV